MSRGPIVRVRLWQGPTVARDAIRRLVTPVAQLLVSLRGRLMGADPLRRMWHLDAVTLRARLFRMACVARCRVPCRVDRVQPAPIHFVGIRPARLVTLHTEVRLMAGGASAGGRVRRLRVAFQPGRAGVRLWGLVCMASYAESLCVADFAVFGLALGFTWVPLQPVCGMTLVALMAI